MNRTPSRARSDLEPVGQISVAVNIPTSNDAGSCGDTLDGFFNRSLDGRHWLVLEDDGAVRPLPTPQPIRRRKVADPDVNLRMPGLGG